MKHPVQSDFPERGTRRAKNIAYSHLASALILASVLGTASPLQAEVSVSGELRQWHKVTLTVDGPQAAETDTQPNPFVDYRVTVTFSNAASGLCRQVPAYFAADGNASTTSASHGDKWRAHLSPDKPGIWTYSVEFVSGPGVAVQENGGQPVAGSHGLKGQFEILPTDKTGRDFRAQGRLQYVGRRYLQFAGTGAYFLKAGPDSPENLLAYVDFDGTTASHSRRTPRAGEAKPASLKSWSPHLRDWHDGDPTWKDGKGKGLIGALNYLASQGCNSFSFLTYNAGGDGDDVWPFITRDDKLHYDCSKLDQWQIVLDHATRLGLFCHFKTQETENDDLKGPGAAQSLDGGDLGIERKLYYRELVARFAHLLALNWNLGEENTQSTAQQSDAARYLHSIDTYHHLVVLHTYPDQQDRVYTPLLGRKSGLTGVSLQNGWNVAHQRVLKWVNASSAAGLPWVVAHDEQNPPSHGVPPDPGYKSPSKQEKDPPYTLHDIRKATLWGTLLAGGAGVEYYFGYNFPENDLGCEDFRSRESSWAYCRIALEFFKRVPFSEMQCADDLVGNPHHDNTRFCFAKPGEIYLVYLPNGGGAELDLTGTTGDFTRTWFNPRTGVDEAMEKARVIGGEQLKLVAPTQNEDWLALLRKE
jgi:hypothetical protein